MSSSNWFGRPNKSEKAKFFSSFGRRGKTPPTSLDINGYSPRTTPSPPSPSPYPNRPPSKSVSSRDDSIGPHTPSDSNRDSVATHNSLLTLSDSDPFAARAISLSSPTHDPNRISKYSNTSLPPDYPSKPPDSRSSYASSSSHGGILDPRPPSPLPTSPELPTRSRPPSRSPSTKLTRKPPNFSSEGSLDDAWEALALGTIHLSNQSQSSLDPTPTSSVKSSSERTYRRVRGITESSATRPNFVPGEIYMNSPPPPSPSYRPPPVSPRVIVRQASQPRLAGPPNVPLPPPPVLDQPFNNPDPGSNLLASSSNISYTSCLSSNGRRLDSQDWNPRPKGKDKFLDATTIMFATYNGDSDLDLTSSIYRAPAGPSTLKKAVSHQSLRKIPSPLPSPATSTPPVPTPDKGIRKQRSFHHPRIPLPPIPNALRTPDTLPNETKRSGATSPSSTRRRLFSSSALRRPSTASNSPSFLSSVDDDSRSLFSIRSDGDHRGASQSVHSLLPDDFGTPERSIPSLHQQEYTPQQILSPADMYIIEANMQPSSPPSRARGLSTSTSRTEGGSVTALSPSSASIRSYHSTSRVTGSAYRQAQNELALPRQPSRPSHSLEDLSGVGDREPSPPPNIGSLPPPPRPRSSPKTGSPSPQPYFNATTRVTALAPPPRRMPSITMEKGLHRRSIMRKPSFLEIDDTDLDDESEEGGEDPTVKIDSNQLNNGAVSSSFLDFARESFDTGR